VNRQHFQAFLWLRWRLRVNQLKRAGTTSTVFLTLLAVFAVLVAGVLLVSAFLLGLFALPLAPPDVLVLVWDVLIVIFLLSWLAGLMTDLQRSDALTLDKFLHLPVSLSSAFLINYLSSLASLTLLLYLPLLVGLSIGYAFGKGPAQLGLLPLLAAFLLLVTGVTYQFQGWLASLMVNQRRRRTVIVVVTMTFVLLVQLPNLFNLANLKGRAGRAGRAESGSASARRAELQRARAANEITQEEFRQRQDELMRQEDEREREEWREIAAKARLASLVLPPGWLAVGAVGCAEGSIVTPLLATLGMALLGGASLWRSYQTTLRLYTGQFTAGQPGAAVAPGKPVAAGPALFLERQLPGLSEQAAAIALASWRGLLRAPEAKMLLLTPVILVVILGTLLFSGSLNLPDLARPLTPLGGMATILLSMVGVVGNQFGFDRSGFRVYVLCAADRRDILLGKNLAYAPLALGMGLFLAVVMQCVLPVRFDVFLAVLPQFVSMYLLFCLLANSLSILAPLAIAPGTLKPANFTVLAFLAQFGFIFALPLALTPVLLPLGVEALAAALGWNGAVPVYLLVALLVCAAVVGLYRFVLTWQGRWLQAREQRILQLVTARVE